MNKSQALLTYTLVVVYTVFTLSGMVDASLTVDFEVMDMHIPSACRDVMGAKMRADINGDGRLDLVGIRPLYPQTSPPMYDAYMCLATADGSYSAAARIGPGPGQDYYYSYLGGDFNGDGTYDLRAIPNDTGILVFLNDGLGNFSEHFIAGYASELFPQTGDVDGDGDLDIYWMSPSGAQWRENVDGSGLVWLIHTLPGVMCESVDNLYTAKLTLTDVDRDGVDDMVYIAGNVSIAVGWWRKLAGSTFATAQTITTSSYCGVGRMEGTIVASADMNNDGALDLVVSLACIVPAVSSARSLRILTHAAAFPWYTILDIPCPIGAGVVGDINEDGYLDLVGNGWWLASDTHGGYNCFLMSSNAVNPYTAIIADVDQDGHPDIDSAYSWARNLGPCPAGTCGTCGGYNGETDTCQTCMYYDVAPDADSVSCRACPTGWAKMDSHTCYPCPVGWFMYDVTNHTLNTTYKYCQQCGLSEFTSQPAQLSCDTCPAGRVPNADHSGCEDCPAGTFSSDSTLCHICGEGKFTTTPGRLTCDTCAAGTVAVLNHTRCLSCPPGTASSDAVGCQPCAAGTSALVGGANSCVACSDCVFAAAAILPIELRTEGTTRYTQPDGFLGDGAYVDRAQTILIAIAGALMFVAAMVIFVVDYRCGQSTRNRCFLRLDLFFKSSHVVPVIPGPLIHRATYAGAIMTLAVVAVTTLIVAALSLRYARDNLTADTSQLPVLTLAEFPAPSFVFNITFLAYGGVCVRSNGGCASGASVTGPAGLSATTCSWSNMAQRACSYVATCDSCTFATAAVTLSVNDSSAFAQAIAYNVSVSTASNNMANWAAGIISSPADRSLQGGGNQASVRMYLRTVNDTAKENNQYAVGVSEWTRGTTVDASNFRATDSPGLSVSLSIVRESFYVYTLVTAKQSFTAFGAGLFGVLSGVLVLGKAILVTIESVVKRLRRDRKSVAKDDINSDGDAEKRVPRQTANAKPQTASGQKQQPAKPLASTTNIARKKVVQGGKKRVRSKKARVSISSSSISGSSSI